MASHKTSRTVNPGKTTIPTRYSPVGGRGPMLGVEEGVEMEDDVVVGTRVVVEMMEEVFAVLLVLEVFDVLLVLAVLNSK